MENVVTQAYKISASDYMKVLFPAYLSDKWYVFVLLLAPFVALTFVNVNFIYVALMVLFFIFPMMLSFVYFFYAFSEECVDSIRRCRVTLDDNGMRRTFLDDEDAPKAEKHYGWNEFGGFVADSRQLRLLAKGRKYRYQLVPFEAFESADDYRRAVEILTKYLPDN